MPAPWGSAFMIHSQEKVFAYAQELATMLSDSRRALAGGYIYMTDAFRPAAAGKHGAVPCRTVF